MATLHGDSVSVMVNVAHSLEVRLWDVSGISANSSVNAGNLLNVQLPRQSGNAHVTTADGNGNKMGNKQARQVSGTVTTSGYFNRSSFPGEALDSAIYNGLEGYRLGIWLFF